LITQNRDVQPMECHVVLCGPRPHFYIKYRPAYLAGQLHVSGKPGRLYFLRSSFEILKIISVKYDFIFT